MFVLLAQCSGNSMESGTEESEEGLTVSDDDLNGIWNTQIGGVAQPDTMMESWSAIGVRFDVGQQVFPLVRTGDALAGNQLALNVLANGSSASDDAIDGTMNGQTVHLTRDTAAKGSITLSFPGDRPFRSFLLEQIVPLAQQDRESYTVMHASKVGPFLKSCELYKHGSWQRKYMKGDTYAEQSYNFGKIINSIENIKTTPRRILKEHKFSQAVTDNLKDPNLAGLALSTFGMYFTTGAGRGLRMPITNDSMAYFITDRVSRAERIGVVVMDTPLHGPLASTFGRQLLDMGAMTAADDAIYARTMMDLLAKSDPSRAQQLSGAGRSALTDWYAVMSIEDYRGMAFGFPTLGWGYNMTNVQFYGLVVKALGGQVIVGTELRPGDPSYADVLNGGADMQEYTDMSNLKVLATNYLREKHPAAVTAVENAFAAIVPKNQTDWRAQRDVFHFVCAELYDNRIASLKGAAANTAIDAVVGLTDILRAEPAAFEAYILAHGYTKSSVPAPKSTGF
jgi:hypothetical protein